MTHYENGERSITPAPVRTEAGIPAFHSGLQGVAGRQRPTEARVADLRPAPDGRWDTGGRPTPGCEKRNMH